MEPRLREKRSLGCKRQENIVAYLRHVKIVTSKHAPAIAQ
jgi:hypothetical protein